MWSRQPFFCHSSITFPTSLWWPTWTHSYSFNLTITPFPFHVAPSIISHIPVLTVVDSSISRRKSDCWVGFEPRINGDVSRNSPFFSLLWLSKSFSLLGGIVRSLAKAKRRARCLYHSVDPEICWERRRYYVQESSVDNASVTSNGPANFSTWC